MTIQVNYYVKELFPWKARDGRNITDELCRCGHRRSRHTGVFPAGHGACMTCDCRKYTWKRFVFGKAQS